MKDCLFCKIIKGEIPSEVVYQDEHAFAFLDIHPKAPGHTMVIPKVHAEHLLELPDVEIAPFFTAVKRAQEMVDKAIKPTGYTLGINHGRVSGQEVDHLHFHIIPRWLGDNGKSIHSVVDNPPKEDLSVIAERIRNV